MKDEKVETEVPETETTETEPVEEIKETELETARREASEYKDLALRRMAELENFRRNNQNLAKTCVTGRFPKLFCKSFPQSIHSTAPKKWCRTKKRKAA